MNNDSHSQHPAYDPKTAALRAEIIDGVRVRERRLDVTGTTTSFLEGGEGPSMVLLHGPGEFAAKWYRILPDLLSTHHVVAPDLPGHGGSEVRAGSLDADQVLAWLDELIQQTCDAPPVLMGHTLGGSIAARFAIRFPRRVRRLVLVDSLGLAPFRPSPVFALRMIHFMARPSERTYDRFMRQCSADLEQLRSEMGSRWSALEAHSVEWARLPQAKAAVKALMKNVGVPAISPDELASISVPVSLIWGRLDRANRVTVAESASRQFGWPLFVVEDCADDPPRDQPAAFLQALRSALVAENEWETANA